MLNRLYITMALYFLGIVITTLLAVTLLVYFTVGRPLTRDIHTMLRSHTRYLTEVVKATDRPLAANPDMNRAFNRFARAYEFEIVLFDHQKKKIGGSSSVDQAEIQLSEEIFEQIEAHGIFVQSSHFNRQLIYMLPVRISPDRTYYLHISKHFPANRAIYGFLTGLAILGLLLSLATYPLSKSITHPITRLTRDLEKIASGRFDHVPDSRRKDEIGELIRGYRNMSQSVNSMILSKKQLLADMSHELCSPLARIRVGTELIKAAGIGGKIPRYIENIETDINSMDHLIGNLAKLSTMNLPGYPLDEHPLDPNDLVDAMVSLYHPIAEKRSIQLISKIPENLPRISGDREQLKQVFCNLMDNALRYTDNGGDIRLGAEEKNNRICFFVEDGGPGVPEADMEKIFEPLYRVDYSRNRKLGGAGLGLALSRKIMELHGGTLQYSRKHEQTRFTFCIEDKGLGQK